MEDKNTGNQKVVRPKRSLAIYLAVFFSAVLIVLFVASYAQGQQIEAAKTDLQTKNTALETLQKQYSDLELKLNDSEAKVDELTKYQKSVEALCSAQNSYNKGDLAGVKTFLEQVDTAVLTPDETEQYTFLTEKVSENNA